MQCNYKQKVIEMLCVSAMAEVEAQRKNQNPPSRSFEAKKRFAQLLMERIPQRELQIGVERVW